MKKSLPLSRVYGLLEPGPVLLVTTAHKGRANVMAQSWHTPMEFEPPLVGCLVSGRNPRTLHHRGRGHFMVAGRTIRLPSRVK